MSTRNIYQLVKKCSHLNPEKAACIYQGNTVSYRELISKVDNLASGLGHIGVRKGSKIALFCPNNLDFVYSLLACAKLGAAIAPLPLTLQGQALSKAVEAADCEYAIAWSTVAKRLLDEQLIAMPKLVVLGNHQLDAVAFETLVNNKHLEHPFVEDVSIDLPFILTMTSGSTGSPKPIVFTQATKIKRAFDATIEYYKLSSDDKVLVSTPLYHSLAQRSLLVPLMLGATAVILPKFSVNAWVEAVEQYRVSFLFAVSSQLIALLPELKEAKLSSLKCVVSSSATLEAGAKSQLLDVLSCCFHECYGASEMGVISDFDVTKQGVPVESVGKPLPSLYVKICDNARREVAVGETGEIACLSQTAFAGYYQQPAQTQASYDDEGYFYTGDLGYVDKEGYLYYIGRSKEVIKSGGINVFPGDIELVVNQLHWIQECAALGVEDAQFGEVILLSVVCNTEAPENVEMALRMYLLSQLTDYQQPRQFMVLPSLPKTGMGKIHKPSIKELYLKKQV
ncbi:class I adenylate-forming enzyme family protein [Pseudoalteromonas sp. MMG012]|uniref:class I adenylate-forming enzyme family protein n=1 Tax=Pseudoalteromonas sp. MMG012 TaxID=2822686 RepID=UPI001B3A0B81|nr:class I adenylate-forming enzyme family protein [Pseudoalteromonas sp. MMG012]MBQ4849028.1 acyl--CoA ligase [Pseudoalteromonas sp. MMG012]